MGGKQSIQVLEASRAGHPERLEATLAEAKKSRFRLRALKAAANSRDVTTGYSALRLAVEAHSHPCVVMLLEAGATANSRAKKGDLATVMHAAAGSGLAENVDVLAAAGAKVNAKSGDPRGGVPLHWSVKHLEATRRLLELGANPNAKDAFGATPLHNAAAMDSAEVVRLLIAQGAQIDLLDASGNTALHEAAAKGHVASVQALVEGGAALELSNAEGKTAADMAAAAGHDNIPVLLSSADVKRRVAAEASEETMN